MLKSNLIRTIYNSNPYLSLNESTKAVNVFFDSITDALKRGQRVEIREFGSFSVTARGAKVSKNPRTGDKLFIPPKVAPYFKSSKKLRARVSLPKKK